MKIERGYCFDDLLLVPRYSEVKTRKNVDLSVDLGKGVKINIPIVSANMKNVTGHTMAKTLSNLGGLPILHRFCTIEENVSMFLKSGKNNVGCSIGVNDKEKGRLLSLYEAGCRIFCVDVAHGDHKNCIDMVQHLFNKYNDCLIIAGNVATAEGAKRLANAGADVIKVGVGPGSICTTRIETGNGVPQMTALSNVFSASMDNEYVEVKNIEPYEDQTSVLGPFPSKRKRKFKIIADGGVRKAGDIVKSICFADAVMMGSVLAGTDEAPGKVIKKDDVPVKSYEGSSTHKTSHIEGVKAYAPLKGPVSSIIQTLIDGIKSGCSYQGVNNLDDIKIDPKFVEISNAGLSVSHPHGIIKG